MVVIYIVILNNKNTMFFYGSRVAGQCGSHGAPGRDMLSESKLRDHLHGSEYVLTYEDRDGDWMLVGEIPWE